MSPWQILLLLLLVLHHQVSAYTPLSDETLQHLPLVGDDFDIYNGILLAPLLIPRVPGTPGSERARRHLVNFFSTYLPNWTIEYQNSTSKTPATGDKEIPFINLIMTRDPPWAKVGEVGRLTIVAHYDSKLYPSGFVGATDSAAPCAMMLHVARSVDQVLTRKWAAMEATGGYPEEELEESKGLQLIFLDGEESFLTWTDEDSLYGSRSLAETWEHTTHPALSTYHNALSSIQLFLLLDLLGAKDPVIRSYFRTTHWAYQKMATAESRLRDLSILRSKPTQQFLPEFDKSPGQFGGYVLDDHIPFMTRGVEILHIIPTPFPDVWHTMEDDAKHLDIPTITDWALIVTAFVGGWMELDEYFPNLEESQVYSRRRVVKNKTEL